jgi:hypothetical protein
MDISNSYRGCFLPWIGHSTEIPRNLQLPLLYPVDKYNVGSFDELWSKTSATDEPGAVWTRAVFKLFSQDQDFQAAFVLEHIGNDPDGHFPEVGWEWQVDIWDDEKLQEWEAYSEHWYDKYWELCF